MSFKNKKFINVFLNFVEQTPHISSSSSINTVTQSKMTSTERVSTSAEMTSGRYIEFIKEIS